VAQEVAHGEDFDRRDSRAVLPDLDVREFGQVLRDRIINAGYRDRSSALAPRAPIFSGEAERDLLGVVPR
jgi:hypothetical protein